MLRSILASSRYIVGLAVLGTFVAGVSLIVYGALTVYDVVRHAFANDISTQGAKSLTIEFIELIDLFLLGTVIYIVALGLYELFIDDQLPLPDWMQISDLDDLKEKLIGVVIVLLGVSFLGTIVEWEGGHDIFYYGASIALVIAALAGFIWISDKGRAEREVELHAKPHQMMTKD